MRTLILLLCSSPEEIQSVSRAFDLLETLIPSTARELRGELARLVMPPCPDGKRYARDTFWDRYAVLAMSWALTGKAGAYAVERLTKQAEKGRPKAIFAPLANLPLPSSRKV